MFHSIFIMPRLQRVSIFLFCECFGTGAGLGQWHCGIADLMPERYLFCNNDRYKFIDRRMYSLFKKFKISKHMATGLAWHKAVLPNLRQCRVQKTDLKIRPIYHRLQRRIEAHICISFVAYKVYKELERQLFEKQSSLSPEKVIDIAKTIFAIKIVHPISKDVYFKTLIITDEQRLLAKQFGF